MLKEARKPRACAGSVVLPNDTLMSDFWPPEPFMVICCSILRKLMHPSIPFTLSEADCWATYTHTRTHFHPAI